MPRIDIGLSCYDLIPGWGSKYSLEGVRQVLVGTWLQLIVAHPQLYISDCPSISEGKIEGSEVVRGSEVQK